MNRVKPEQKKNKTSPIVPPVAITLYLPYKASICEFVINMAAKNLSMSILMFLSFISYLKASVFRIKVNFNKFFITYQSYSFPGSNGVYVFQFVF